MNEKENYKLTKPVWRSGPEATEILGAEAWKNYLALRVEQKRDLNKKKLEHLSHLVSEVKSRKPLKLLDVIAKQRFLRQEIEQARISKTPLGSVRKGSNVSFPISSHWHWPAERALGVPEGFVLFDHEGNYNSAHPSENFLQTPSDIFKGIGAMEIESYVDPTSGKMSLGCAGGNWEGFFSTPMEDPDPENNVFGYEEVVSTATMFDGCEIPTDPGSREYWSTGDSSLTVTAAIYCPVKDSTPPHENVTLLPGAQSAPPGTLIALASLSLTVSYISVDGKVLQSESVSNTMMSFIASSGPGSSGLGVNLLDAENVFLPSINNSQVTMIAVTLPFSGGAFPNHLIVEVGIELQGMRTGRGAQGAGYVALSFQDWKPGTITPIWGLEGDDESHPCPFQVVGIKGVVNGSQV